MNGNGNDRLIAEKKFSHLGIRCSTSGILIATTAYFLFFAGAGLFSLWVILFIGLGLYEFFTLLRGRGVPVYRLFGVCMGVMVPVMVYLEQGMTQSGEVLSIVLGCLFLFLLQFSRRNNSEALIGISLTLFGILYVSWFLSYLIKIRFLPDGIFWVLYVVAVTKFADTGAYLVGTLIGRHKLLDHISPKKSVEGLFGGIAASALASCSLKPYLPLDFSYFHAAVLGAGLGVIGQTGDLSESLMKRFCESKDSGRLLPGMGGVLDLVDSVLFTAPLFYFHIQLFYK